MYVVSGLKFFQTTFIGDYSLHLDAPDETGLYPGRADPYEVFTDVQEREKVQAQ